MATRLALTLIGLGFSAGALGGCSNDSTPNPSSTGMPYTLYAHCGIHQVSVDGVIYELEDGQASGGNHPPPGWQQMQEGTLSVTGDTAIFTDDQGQHLTFVRAPSATQSLCK
jgi:hypothetical protein